MVSEADIFDNCLQPSSGHIISITSFFLFFHCYYYYFWLKNKTIKIVSWCMELDLKLELTLWMLGCLYERLELWRGEFGKFLRLVDWKFLCFYVCDRPMIWKSISHMGTVCNGMSLVSSVASWPNFYRLFPNYLWFDCVFWTI